MPKHGYLIMDGRARYDQDRAIVCEVCDTLAEAKRQAPNYGDAVVVDSDTNEIVWDGEAMKALSRLKKKKGRR